MEKDIGNDHGWTFDTLKEFIDEREARTSERFTSMKREVDAALAASDRAVNKAEVSTEKRFESVNEFRSALADQTTNLLPRVEYNVKQIAIDKHLDELQTQVTNLIALGTGRATGFNTIGSIVMGSVTILAVLIAFGTMLVHIYK